MTDVAVLTPIIAVGLAAGFAPGPTSTLVITETFRHGLVAGAKVALAPLITDVPIMFAALALTETLANNSVVLGIISILGGIFLLYLSYEIFCSALNLSFDTHRTESRSFIKGVLTNLLNPGPYLFWGTVGTAMLLNAFKISPSLGYGAAILFLTTIVGAKFTMAVVAKYSKTFLSGSIHVCMVRGLAVLMLFYSGYYFFDGATRLGII